MAIQYKVYFREQGDSWAYQGLTTGLSWDISAYSFDYFTIYEWRVDTYDTVTELTTTGDTWTFIVQRSAFGLERRNDYDENKIWDPVTEAWVDINDFEYTGGGRYNQQIIVVGHKCIYFGEV